MNAQPLNAYAQSGEKGVLVLTCSKCTRWAKFSGKDQKEAGEAAVKAKWKMRGAKFVCSNCP